MSLRLPILRHGRPYASAETLTVPHVLTGAPVATLDQANAGLIRRDARRAADARAALRALPTAERLDRMVRAATIFAEDDLPVGDGVQSPDRYLEQLSATTGLPLTLCRANLAKVVGALQAMPRLVEGLTRGLPLEVLDRGFGRQGAVDVGLVSIARSLSAVLPSNSPGVHTLWLPALALGVPVALKPGGTEPWTPYRLVAALTAAGLPPEAFSLYPTDHEGADALVAAHDRAMVFGGATVAARYAGRPEVEVHGPGYAKILVGRDVSAADHLDVLLTSVASNGGRSCINASTLLAPDARDLGERLARDLTAWGPTPLDHPDARLACFPDARVAEAIDARLDALLAEPGATDLSAPLRGPRRVEAHGLTWLLPTVVHCARPDHPLARTEQGFPFVAVVDLPADPVPALGPTLVLTALTDDPALLRALLDAPHVERLHVGPIPTSAIQWDQPHEGNLFEALYRRRAFARAPLDRP